MVWTAIDESTIDETGRAAAEGGRGQVQLVVYGRLHGSTRTPRILWCALSR